MAVSSQKTIFGRCGPLIKNTLLTHWTISRKFKNCSSNNSLLLNTKRIKYIIQYTFLVKILMILNNPQITNSRSKNFKPGIIHFSWLSLIVGISEAIRSVLTTLSFRIIITPSPVVQGGKIIFFLFFIKLIYSLSFASEGSFARWTEQLLRYPGGSRFTPETFNLTVNFKVSCVDITLLPSDYRCQHTKLPSDAKLEDNLNPFISSIRRIFMVKPWQRELAPQKTYKNLFLFYLRTKHARIGDNNLSGPACPLDTRETSKYYRGQCLTSGRRWLTCSARANFGKPSFEHTNFVKSKDEKFNQWLAGLIDGDGCFLLSKKGYASLEIVMQLRDKRCLYQIKQNFGGAVKLHAGDNYLRYRLHHKAGLLNLIHGVNGLIRNPIRILQLGKICEKYGIMLQDPKPLTYYDGWLAGFFDSDGSIYLSETSGQLFVTATQKNRYMLEALVQLYGGKIYPLVKKEAFKWTLFSIKEISPLVNDYFKVNPCRSEKRSRIVMVPKLFELRQLRAIKASPNSDLGKAWKHFLVKWNNFRDKKELN